MIFGKLGSIKTQALMGAAVAVIAHSSAYAQETKQADFDIAAKDLGSALTDFAMQSDVEVLFNGADVRGKKSKTVKGRYTPRQAISILLNGTGVRYRQNADGTLLVGQSSVGQRSSQTNEAGDPVVVTGKLTDERTGANLKGASVTIEETGQSTSTDDLGNYRFPSVRPGRYTLRVSYLGYQEILVPITVQAGRPFQQNFAMIGGSAIQEIVVYGTRSARAQSLNQERSAENSQTVLASDFLGNFDGDTISEALRRAPGIAFEQDPVTGDGTNVIVRGLAPDLNTVTLNGLRLPEGSGTGRSANLGNILTDSISKITINKTLLPSQDSSGTGGLIEIETKGPLDRDRRFANFNVSGAQRGKGFRDEFLVSGTVSGKFGSDDNFGLSASVQYREQDIKRLNYRIPNILYGQYLPLAEDGTVLTSVTRIDPRTAFPFEPDIDEVYPFTIFNSFNKAQSSNLTVSLSGQWKIGNHTDLRLDYTRAQEQRDTFTRTVSTASDLSRYVPVAIDDLGGEVRGALVSENLFPGFPGLFVSNSQTYSVDRDIDNTTNSFSFRGTTAIKSWEFEYSAGYAEGRIDEPFTGFLSAPLRFFNVRPFINEEGEGNTTSDGRIIMPFSPLDNSGYPVPLFTQEGFDFFNTSDNYNIASASLRTGSGGKNTRFTIDASVRYNFNTDHLKYLELGIFYEDADFTSRPILSDDQVRLSPTGGGVTLADLGLVLSEEPLADIGLSSGLNAIAQSDINAFFDSFNAIADSNPNLTLANLAPLDPRLQEAFSNEKNLSAYFQSRVDLGKLAIVAGARLDHIEISTRNLSNPSIIDATGQFDFDFLNSFSELVDQRATQTQILPRAALTYRHSENLLFRAGYAATVARPRISNLSREQQVSLDQRPIFGPNGNRQQLRIRQGNPDLKPARTQNFDISMEKYFSDAGQFKLSLFYKTISNALELNVNGSTEGLTLLDDVPLPDDPRFQSLPDDIFVIFSTPDNAETNASIWGAEVAFEKQLTFLPGFLGGFGVYANYTYTDSSKDQPLTFFDSAASESVVIRIEDVPFSGSPKHSGTAALTYNKYGLDATLAYTTQARRLNSFRRHNLSVFDERDESLDFRAEYRFKKFGADWRVWLEGSDLLKGSDDPDVETSIGGTGNTPKILTGGNYFGGRSASLGFGVTF